jgi:hypothetical protein
MSILLQAPAGIYTRTYDSVRAVDVKVLIYGLHYLRWGGDSEAVQPEKCSGVENCLRLPQNPQRQVNALLGFVKFLESLTPIECLCS